MVFEVEQYSANVAYKANGGLIFFFKLNDTHPFICQKRYENTTVEDGLFSRQLPQQLTFLRLKKCYITFVSQN